MRLVVVLSLLTLASTGSGHLVGPNECAKGPVYWCSNLMQAKQCGAVDHCLQTVWTQQKGLFDPADTPQCQYCQEVVNMAREVVSRYQNDIETIFQKVNEACDLWPEGKGRAECHEVVQEIDAVVELLIKSNMTSQDICQLLSMCEEQRRQLESNAIDQPRMPTPVKVGDVCTSCVAFFADVKAEVVAEATEAQVNAMLKSVICDQLSSGGAICSDIVDIALPRLWNYVDSAFDPTAFCTAIRICDSAPTPLLQKKFENIKFVVNAILNRIKGVPPAASDEECVICKAVTAEIGSLADNPTLQADVTNWFKQTVCANLGNLADMCNQEIDKYASTVFQLLDELLVSGGLCTDLGLCNSSKSISKAVQSNAVYQLHVPTPVKVGAICDSCTQFLTDLKAILVAEDTENQVISTLKTMICDQLGPVEAVCDDLVDTLIPRLWDYVDNLIVPSDICTALGFCDSTPTLELQKKLENFKKVASAVLKKITGVPEKASSLECDACKDVTAEIRSLARDQAVQATITDWIKENVCSYFGGFALECRQAVDDNAPEVFQLIAGSLIDDGLCVDLGMCSSGSVSTTSAVQFGTIQCDVCKTVISYLDHLDSSPTIQNEILQFVENVVCPNFGASADVCKQDVKTYGLSVLKVLQNVLNGPYLCGKVDICATTPKVKSNAIVCDICEAGLTELKEWLCQKSVQDAIEQYMDNICQRLSGNLSAECKTFVDEYAPLVFSLVTSELDPNEVCKDTGLCGATQVKPVVNKYSDIIKMPENAVTCDVCEEVVKELKSTLKTPSIKEKVRQELDNLCSKLGEYQDECETALNLEYDTIYEILVDDIDEKVVCTDINLCQSQQKNILEKLTPKKVQLTPVKGSRLIEIFKKVDQGTSGMCVACETVLTLLQEALKEPTTDDFIRNILDEACDLLPEDFEKAPCKNLVKTYATQLIQWLRDMDDPYIRCPELGLCKSSQPDVKETIKDTKLYFRKHLFAKERLGSLASRYQIKKIPA